jgi:hypothetical protein
VHRKLHTFSGQLLDCLVVFGNRFVDLDKASGGVVGNQAGDVHVTGGKSVMVMVAPAVSLLRGR